MKKSIMIMLISFTAVFLLSAADGQKEWFVITNHLVYPDDHIDLKVKQDALITMEIKEIPSNNFSSTEGMPFYLNGDDVSPENSSHGRKIAAWNLTSNTSDIDVKVTADSLSHSTGKTVDYVLWFDTHYDSSGTSIGFEVSSANTFEGSLYSGESIPDTVSFEDNGIYFKLADDISDDSYPVGDYTANVTIEVTYGGDL